MKRLILTSEHFQGEVHIQYDVRLNLQKIDFTHAELTDKQILYMKGLTPTTYKSDEFIFAYKSKALRCLEEDVIIDFEQDFWNPYDNKINKIRVLKLWDKLSKADQQAAVSGLLKYNYHLQLEKWKKKLDPENYLKNRAWENEWN